MGRYQRPGRERGLLFAWRLHSRLNKGKVRICSQAAGRRNFNSEFIPPKQLASRRLPEPFFWARVSSYFDRRGQTRRVYTSSCDASSPSEGENMAASSLNGWEKNRLVFVLPSSFFFFKSAPTLRQVGRGPITTGSPTNRAGLDGNQWSSQTQWAPDCQGGMKPQCRWKCWTPRCVISSGQ